MNSETFYYGFSQMQFMWDHALFPYKAVNLPTTKSYLNKFNYYSVICWEHAETSDSSIRDANDPNTLMLTEIDLGAPNYL